MNRDPADDAIIADAARGYCAARLALTDDAYVDSTLQAICRLDTAWEALVIAYDEEQS